jgi:hypothetical protein
MAATCVYCHVRKRIAAKTEDYTVKSTKWMLVALALTLAGCGVSKDGNTSVEFMADGKAHFSLHGVGGACTYSQDGDRIRLICVDGETLEFTVGEDGALSGPPDSFVTRLSKRS